MKVFGLTCGIPPWAYNLYSKVEGMPRALTNQEFKTGWPDQYKELETFLAPYRTEEFGYKGENWKDDPSVYPEGNACGCWWFCHPSGVILWKWQYDHRNHGEAFYIPGSGWTFGYDPGEQYLWEAEDLQRVL